VLKCDRDERKGQKGTAWVQRYRSRLDVGASPRVRFSSMKFLVPAYGSRGDVTQVWAEKGTTLTELADGVDLLVAGITEQGLAANVAEYHGIPLAALHFYPVGVLELGWLDWRITKEAEHAHRRALGLPEATDRALG
jgi:hypothetical protein